MVARDDWLSDVNRSEVDGGNLHRRDISQDDVVLRLPIRDIV